MVFLFIMINFKWKDNYYYFAFSVKVMKCCLKQTKTKNNERYWSLKKDFEKNAKFFHFIHAFSSSNNKCGDDIVISSNHYYYY